MLEIVERSLQCDLPDIETATEAHDEAIRRDNEKVIRKMENIFRRTDIRPIPWLADAKRSLSVLELPPFGHYQGHPMLF